MGLQIILPRPPDFTVLESRLSTAENDIGALETDVGTLQTDLGTAESDIDTLQSGLTTANGNISSLTTTVTNLDVTQSGISTGSTSDASFTSTSYATLDGNTGGQLAVTLNGTADPTEIDATVTVTVMQATAGDAFTLALALDGGSEVAAVRLTSKDNNRPEVLTTTYRWTGVTGGTTHSVRARALVSGGTWTLFGVMRHMTVREYKR